MLRQTIRCLLRRQLPKRNWTDDRQVTDAGQSLPHRSHASSKVALQLKHIAALEPATVSVDELAEWVKAKMGRGLDTALDESRRRCKVLVPKATKQGKGKKATATPPPAATTPIIVHWPGLEAALESTRKQLCPWFPPGSLHAHLHTVQQHDVGDVFTPHRDALKLPYHIITLSVDCSPARSTHNGGGVRLNPCVKTEFPHGEKTVTSTEIPFSGSGSFAAWYSHNSYEVLPVTKGRRLSATYNITVDAAVAKGPFNCDDPEIEKAVDEAAAKLRPLESVFDNESIWILKNEYIFDPQYKGNHAFLLAGRDRLKHEAMCRAFGRDRVVVTEDLLENDEQAPSISQPEETLIDWDDTRNRLEYHEPLFKEHGFTSWNIATLSLKPKTTGNENETNVDKKENEE